MLRIRFKNLAISACADGYFCESAHSVIRLLLATLLLVFPLSVGADNENRIKSGFLLNFPKFVTWPAPHHTEGNEKFRYCVLNGERYRSALFKSLRGQSIQAKPIDLVFIDSIDQANNCAALFVGKWDVDQAGDALGLLLSPAVLTIADDIVDESVETIIRFYKDGSNLRFEINPDKAAEAGLVVSSRLLAIARIRGTESRSEP